ncbi:methylmalonyl Co-A mutase-associated GTPase MeaB [Halobacterium sp. R2-5]|uniref:methylmalonyl Co-A mutase-associated GTPase MeaB n=1 Tax=Halobacterium sp. R2-5 TaxID=2715751 RepID=UPI001423DB92|nr:methylmalonyl Co-A mutase-associated GTPase MeaB [Halobacterium sp. R2-5]NIB98868.1 methylmalonyl Co-A mutase-associated GTPase MeaB [Halobacterium sp. R2-5]
MAAQDAPELVDELLAGKHRALARTITRIENRSSGYRDLVAALYPHTGNADVIGITGSPGSGKSTLVDKMAAAYRDQELTVGVIAVDPSSPFTGGAVLGDRIRMASTATDMDVFFRSMSARGSLGGLSTATADAVKALDAFGKDKIIIETVGAGQNEVDVVKTADTVAVLVPPSSGDDVQMLKAGILEIGDVFVVNKADLAGADKTVTELKNMLDMRDAEPGDWTPRVVETVANSGEGVSDFLDVLGEHAGWLDESGRREDKRYQRHAEELRNLLREDASELIEDELDARGGVDQLVERIDAGETTPYDVADDVVGPLADCLDERRD